MAKRSKTTSINTSEAIWQHSHVITPWFYKNSHFNVDVSGSKQRAFTSHVTASPRSPCGDIDRGSIANIGGSVFGADRRRVRVDASELKPLDALTKRPGFNSLDTREAAWTPASVNLKPV